MSPTVESLPRDKMQPSTLQSLMANEQLLPLPRYDEAFYLYSFKIVPCSNTLSHNWSLCPFVHAKEKARRRDPRLYTYQPLPCPEDRKGTNCPRGDQCPYTHNVYEYWLHPQRFRTQMCQQGSACTRPLCFFAHTLEELRVVDQQSNIVVSAAQLAPAAGPAGVVPGVQGLAGSSHAAGPGLTHAQQSWMQQPMMQHLAGNPGAHLFDQQSPTVGFQPMGVQQPQLPQQPMQDAALQQHQHQLLQQAALQQLQLQQAALQQMQGIGAMQQAQGMLGGASSSNFQGGQQQQGPFGFAGAATQQAQPFGAGQQFQGNQQPWHPQMLLGTAQAQQLAQAAAGQGQPLLAGGLQGMMPHTAGPQQQGQVHVLQQPQQPWLQPQMAPGSSAARPQILHMNSLQPGGAGLAGLAATDQALQAAMQQMVLDNAN